MRIYRLRKFPARLLVILLLLILILFKPKPVNTLGKLALDVLAKPFKVFTEGSIFFSRIKEVSNENMLLKERVAALSVELWRMRETALENERLQTLLNFKGEIRYKTVIAKVIGRDVTDWRKSILINKGRPDGISQGMPCATEKGFIGSVAEVGFASSKVILLNDPDSRVGVILEPSRESGVLIGSTEGTATVIYLSLDSDIKKGERVVTGGFRAPLPKGLVIGEVVRVANDRTGLFQYAVLEPFVDMDRVEEVICIDTQNRGK